MRTCSHGPSALGGDHSTSPRLCPDIVTTTAGSPGWAESGHGRAAAHITRRIRTLPVFKLDLHRGFRRIQRNRWKPYVAHGAVERLCAEFDPRVLRGSIPEVFHRVGLLRAVRETNPTGLNRLAVNRNSRDVLPGNVAETHHTTVGDVDVNRGGCRRVLMDGRRFVRSIGDTRGTHPRILEDLVVVIARNAVWILRRPHERKASQQAGRTNHIPHQDHPNTRSSHEILGEVPPTCAITLNFQTAPHHLPSKISSKTTDLIVKGLLVCDLLHPIDRIRVVGV